MAQQSHPLHIENTVLTMGQRDLDINHAFHTYRSMKQDPIISGSIGWIKSIISKSDFNLVAHPKATIKEKKVTEAINQSFKNLPYRKRDIVGNILTMLDYGCSLHEVVLKKTEDGVVFNTISPVHLTSVHKFQYRNGRLEKLILNPTENDGQLYDDGRQSEISGQKILNFRLEADSDNPLGRSLLQGCYRSWRTKLIIEEYLTIAAAKNLSTVVKLSVPLDYINDYMSDPSSDNAMYVEQALQQVEMLHAGKSSYVMLPSDCNVNGVALFDVAPLSNVNNTYDGEKSVERLNKEILFSLQTQVLNLGTNSQGSFALASNSTSLLGMWLENVFSIMCDELNKAVNTCWIANGLKASKAPTVKFDDLDEADITQFADALSKLQTSGFVQATEGDNTVIREMFNLPAVSSDIDVEEPTDGTK